MKLLARNELVNQAEADEVFKELAWHLAGVLQKSVPISRRIHTVKARNKSSNSKPRLRPERSTSAAVGS